MKTADSSKPQKTDSEQQTAQAAAASTTWREDQAVARTDSVEIFYDGREVYGGY